MGFNELYGKSAAAGWTPQFTSDTTRDLTMPHDHQAHYWDFPLAAEASLDPSNGLPITWGSMNGNMSTKDNGWALYQDNAWEFGDLDTAEQLKDALALVEESGDGKWAGTEPGHEPNPRLRRPELTWG